MRHNIIKKCEILLKKILYQQAKSLGTLVSLNFRVEAKTKATFITSKQKMYSVIPILSLEVKDRFEGI